MIFPTRTGHDRGRPLARLLLPALLLPFLLGSRGPQDCGPLPPTLPPGVSSITVSPTVAGFGGGTLYYPTGATGPHGAVAVVSGYLGTQRSIRWYGPLLAAEGFVTLTIETHTPEDDPQSRGQQLLAALGYLVGESQVSNIVDPERLAVMGWSMGGGGALEASLDVPALAASVPLAPWSENVDFATVTVPTLIVACESDEAAPNVEHSIPIYESISPTVPKTYLEIAAGEHTCVATANETIGAAVVAWMQLFLDGDTDAASLLCPPLPLPSGGPVSAFESTCPF